jgi:hypothetical protein
MMRHSQIPAQRRVGTAANVSRNAQTTVVEARMRRFVTAAKESATTPGSALRKLAICAAVTVGIVAAAPSEASAQEIQMTGPLKGAPAVRQLRLYREGRFEIAPSFSFTFLDEYRRTMFLGARLQYNIKEWVGIGAWGAFGLISTTTDLTDQINAQAPRDKRTNSNLNPAKGDSFQAQTAKMNWIVAPQITITPFRGKLAVFQKLFVDADAYFHVGAAFVGLEERGDCGGDKPSKCTDAKSFTPLTSRVAIAPTFGLGMTFYASSLLSLGLEYRAFPFAWNRAGFDSRGKGNNAKFPDGKINSDDRTFRFNQMISLSIGIFPQKRATSE